MRSFYKCFARQVHGKRLSYTSLIKNNGLSAEVMKV